MLSEGLSKLPALLCTDPLRRWHRPRVREGPGFLATQLPWEPVLTTPPCRVGAGSFSPHGALAHVVLNDRHAVRLSLCRVNPAEPPRSLSPRLCIPRGRGAADGVGLFLEARGHFPASGFSADLGLEQNVDGREMGLEK